MAEKKSCEVLAMLIADSVFREEDTHKVHIAGTFNQVNAHAFPALHPRMHVYVAITGAEPGPHAARIELRYADPKPTDKLPAIDGPVKSDSLETITEMNVTVESVTFPRAGTIEVVFSWDGKKLASRTLRIVDTGR